MTYRPLDALLLAFDAQLTGWSTYKTLNINFLDPAVSSYDQHLVKDYKNAWAFFIYVIHGADVKPVSHIGIAGEVDRCGHCIIEACITAHALKHCVKSGGYYKTFVVTKSIL